MQKVLYFLAGCLLVLLCLTASAYAQDLSTGEIVGSVLDSQGAHMAAATVTVTKDSVFAARRITNAEGNYAVKLPPGKYRLEVFVRGAKKSKSEEVVVSADTTTTMDLSIESESVAETAEQQHKAKASLISAGLALLFAILGLISFWFLRKQGPFFWKRWLQLSVEEMPIKGGAKNGQQTGLARFHLSGSMAVFHCTTYAFVYGYFIYVTLTVFNLILGNRSVSTEELNSLGQFSNWIVSDPASTVMKGGVLLLLVVPLPYGFAILSKFAVDYLTLKILEIYSLNENPEQNKIERVESTVSEIHRRFIALPEEAQFAIGSLEKALQALEEIVPEEKEVASQSRASKHKTVIPFIISSDSHLVDLSKGIRPTALVIVAQRIWYYNNWYGVPDHEYFPRGDQEQKFDGKEIHAELDRILKQAISTCVSQMRKNYKEVFGIEMKTKYADSPRSIRLIFGSVKDLVSSAKHIDLILGSEALYPVPTETTKEEINVGAQEITDTADEIAPKAETLEILSKDTHDAVHEKVAKDVKEGIEKIGDEGENIISLTQVIETREEGILNIWISEPVGRRMKVEKWAENKDDKDLFNSLESSVNLKSLLAAYWTSLGKGQDPDLFDNVKTFGDDWPDHDFLAVGGLLYQPGYLKDPTTNANEALRGFIGLLPIVLMALNFKHVLPFQEITHAIAEGSENHAYYETRITDFQTKGTVGDPYA